MRHNLQSQVGQLQEKYSRGLLTGREYAHLLGRYGQAPELASDTSLGASRSVTMKYEDAEALVSQLEAKGIPASFEAIHPPKYFYDYLTFPKAVVVAGSEQYLLNLAGEFLAPTSGALELVGKFDRKKDTLALLRPQAGSIITLEMIQEWKLNAGCSRCQRTDHRHLWIVWNSSNSSYEMVGSNCAAAVFGVGLKELWPTGEITRKAKENISDALLEWANQREIQESKRYFEARLPTGWSVDRVIAMFQAEVEERGVTRADYAYNTLCCLRKVGGICRMVSRDSATWEITELSKWGHSIVRSVERHEAKVSVASLSSAPKPSKPEVLPGSRASFEATVRFVKVVPSPYNAGNEVQVTLFTESGWKLWMRNSNPAFQRGNLVRFEARVKDHGSDISFLSRPTKIQVLKEAEDLG